MGVIEDRLAELGFELPEVAKPVAAYIPALRVGDLVMTSGQLPMVGGQLVHLGHVRSEQVHRAAQDARTAVLNALAAVKSVIGDLDRVRQVVRVVVYVQCDNTFHQQPQVANGASELLLEVFGEKGRHVRSAVGASSLPLNATVEVELTVQVE
jgi:enamine deaminase RidA (YjgF/YER057c/UK114 family)